MSHGPTRRTLLLLLRQTTGMRNPTTKPIYLSDTLICRFSPSMNWRLVYEKRRFLLTEKSAKLLHRAKLTGHQTELEIKPQALGRSMLPANPAFPSATPSMTQGEFHLGAFAEG